MPKIRNAQVEKMNIYHFLKLTSGSGVLTTWAA